MKIDFSKFKKIDEDDKITTLMHESGHSLKIAHKGLSKEHQSELQKIPMHLAKGGRAKFAQKFDPNLAKNNTRGYMPRPSQVSKPQAGPTNLVPKPASKAYTEPQDSGPDVALAALNKEAPPFGPLGTEAKQHYPPCINPSCKSFGHSHPNCRCYGGVPESGHFAEGGKVDDQYYCDNNRMHRKECEYFAEGGETSRSEAVSGHDKEKDIPLAESPAVEVSPEEVSSQEPEQVSTQPMGQPPLNPNPENANSAPAPAATESVPETPKVAAQPDPYAADVNDPKYLSNLLNNEQAKFEQDVNSGNIKPETYSTLFGKKDTLGKIGTLFGLMLGGVGSGLTGQPNALLSMMDQTIKRDLEAQETSAKNRQTISSINGTNLMNLANAGKTGAEIRQMHIAQNINHTNYLTFHYLAQNANKYPVGSKQWQDSQNVLGFLYKNMKEQGASVNDQAAGAAAMANMLGGQNGGQPNTTMMKSGMMGPEMKEVGEDVESKSIPGVPGRATRPIPQSNRDELQAMDTLSKKAADLMSFAKAHKGTLSPSQRALGEQKAAEMVNFYNGSLTGGALTQGRLHWLDQQINKNPTSVFQDMLGNNKRLQEIKDSNDMRKNIVLKQLGFPIKEGAAAQNQQQSGIQMSGGKPYRLDPTGKFMIPVK